MQRQYPVRMKYWFAAAERHDDQNQGKDTVRSDLVNGIVEGINSGMCGIIEMPKLRNLGTLRINDGHFKLILEVLAKRPRTPKEKKEGVVLSFPDNKLTDASLVLLGDTLRENQLPVNLVLDLSGDNRFTVDGIKAFTRALEHVDKNLNVEIKLPSHTKNIGEDTMRGLREQINSNRDKYQLAAADKKPKRKTSKAKADTKSALNFGGLFKKKDEAAKPKSKAKYEKVDDEDKKKRGMGRSSKK
jgi:hypothetical protein